MAKNRYRLILEYDCNSSTTQRHFSDGVRKAILRKTNIDACLPIGAVMVYAACEPAENEICTHDGKFVTNPDLKLP